MDERAATSHNSDLADRLRALEQQNAQLQQRIRDLDPGVSVGDKGKGRHGTLILVSSAKGGVGKSVIAASLAAGLVLFHNQRTVLVDANLEFGDQSMLFNIHTDKTLAHLAGIHSIDERVATDLLTTHPSGLSVVAGPPDPIFAEQIPPSVMTELVRAYRADFDYIVVDSRAGFGELNLDLLEESDVVLLVATPEMNTAAHTGHFLAVVRRLGHGDKVKLILNRSNTGLKAEVLSNFLDIPVASSIVSGGEAFIQATNTGESVFSRDPEARDPITRDLHALVATAIGRPHPSNAAGRGEKDRSSSPAAAGPQPRRPRRVLAQLAGGLLTVAGLIAIVAAGLAVAQEWSRGIAPPANADVTIVSPPNPSSVGIALVTPAPPTLPIATAVTAPISPVPVATAVTAPVATEAPVAVSTPETVVVEVPPEDPPEPVATLAPTLTATVNFPGTNSVSLHRTASLSAPLLRLIPVGTEVKIRPGSATISGVPWQEVETLDGVVGWVLARTLQY